MNTEEIRRQIVALIQQIGQEAVLESKDGPYYQNEKGIHFYVDQILSIGADNLRVAIVDEDGEKGLPEPKYGRWGYNQGQRDMLEAGYRKVVSEEEE